MDMLLAELVSHPNQVFTYMAFLINSKGQSSSKSRNPRRNMKGHLNKSLYLSSEVHKLFNSSQSIRIFLSPQSFISALLDVSNITSTSWMGRGERNRSVSFKKIVEDNCPVNLKACKKCNVFDTNKSSFFLNSSTADCSPLRIVKKLYTNISQE